MARELFGMFYSPWTEKARWALDHHQIPYAYREHVMILGVPRLRWRLRRFRGGITVPALIDQSGSETFRLMDSREIACHADRFGKGSPLFPEGREEELRWFNEWSEAALAAGRGLVVEKIRRDPEAQKAALSPILPEKMKDSFLFMARMGLAYLAREFDLGEKSGAEYEMALRKILWFLRNAVSKGEGGCLLGRFSYADIAMAVVLQFVEPVSDDFVPMGAALRRCWRNEQLCREFSDLLEWRDRIYERHRPVRP